MKMEEGEDTETEGNNIDKEKGKQKQDKKVIIL